MSDGDTPAGSLRLSSLASNDRPRSADDFFQAGLGSRVTSLFPSLRRSAERLSHVLSCLLSRLRASRN